MYFQDVIGTLQRYWGDRGCVIVQPHDLMMGAGTFHPATVLRSLGPGAWRCAYVQPSRRPGDARYGDNPNRLGHYYQFQVILKPSPLEVLDLYLGSLAAIGIDLGDHDVRFVEDDWKSPTLGAWGIGWEVWLDGMEVTQFTYFQQVGGIPTLPVPAEITYGLERLCAQLQGVESVYDVQWAPGVTYRDVFWRNEVEQSRYNFELSDPEALFAEYARNAEASRALAEAGLALPAYDRAIQCSHTFNLLDARGAISVAERANYIDSIRALSVRCAEVWHEQVAQHEPPVPAPPPAVPGPPPTEPASGNRQLLVEVVCEELPPGAVRSMLGQLRDGVLGLLGGIEHGAVRTWATPRRLAVVVDAVAEASPRQTRRITGPPVDRALKDGVPTKAGEGFARGKGVDPAALIVVDGPKGQVVAVDVAEGGERTVERVAQGLDAVIRGIDSPKAMVWDGRGPVGAPDPPGQRRVRRAAAGRRGRRGPARRRDRGAPASARAVPLPRRGRLARGPGGRWVEPDLDGRRERIRGLLAEARERLGADDLVDEALLEEVTHLVEAPTLVIGRFDPALLALPPRLLVQTMKQNQRYFPVFRDGALASEFVVIANNPGGDLEAIARGNASVLLARFDDARFFVAEDRRSRSPSTGGASPTCGGSAGSARWRSARSGSRRWPWRWRRPSAPTRPWSRRRGRWASATSSRRWWGSSRICRATSAGCTRRGGMAPAAALAIEEQWQPRGADDAVAASPAGVALALADRLDALAACFGVGMVPKGGGDPQGLRRAVQGLLRTVIEHRLRLDLRALFRLAVAQLHDAVRAAPDGYEAWARARGTDATARDAEALVEELVAFALARFRAGAAATADVVDAVVTVSEPDPLVLHGKVEALAGLAGHAEFAAILTVFKRVLNITVGQDAAAPAAGDLTVDAERQLQRAVEQAEGEVAGAVAALDYRRALDRTLALRQPVADLFDAVMVDSPDPRERAVRMGLLLRVARTFRAVADFSRISTR
ncbi:MAG: glycine--tRNA ligase subunit alpha [Myxococcota bacterium]